VEVETVHSEEEADDRSHQIEIGEVPVLCRLREEREVLQQLGDHRGEEVRGMGVHGREERWDRVLDLKDADCNRLLILEGAQGLGVLTRLEEVHESGEDKELTWVALEAAKELQEVVRWLASASCCLVRWLE